MNMDCITIVAFLLRTAESTEDLRPVNLRCGSYCVYLGLKATEIPIKSFEELETFLGQPGPAGYSMLQLQQAAEHFGAHTLALDTKIENLQRRKDQFVCIVLLQGNHFVNVYDLGQGKARIVDPPDEYVLPMDTFRAMWDGKALLIASRPLQRSSSRGEWTVRWLGIAAVGVITVFALWATLRIGRRFRDH